MSIIGIAQSGMRASQARLAASASNVANINSTGPIAAPVTFGPIGKAQEDGAAYRPIRTEQTAQVGGGVATRYSPVGRPYTLRYQPDAAGADTYGMVAAPNVDLAQEAAERLSAAQDFKANARVVQTDADITRSTLEIWG